MVELYCQLMVECWVSSALVGGRLRLCVLFRGQLGTGVHVFMSKWSEGVRAGVGSEFVSGRFLEALGGPGGGGIVRGGSMVRATCSGF